MKSALAAKSQLWYVRGEKPGNSPSQPALRQHIWQQAASLLDFQLQVIIPLQARIAQLTISTFLNETDLPNTEIAGISFA